MFYGRREILESVDDKVTGCQQPTSDLAADVCHDTIKYLLDALRGEYITSTVVSAADVLLNSGGEI